MSRIGFTYRTLYTWDHSTNWDLRQPGARVSGCHEAYGKPAAAFLNDYRRLIDFMASVGLNHLIIWGALRDGHGGADALRAIVDHGRRKNVRAAPGVGVNCYGGTYYEGEHEYNLFTFLKGHPELAAVGEDGRPRFDPRKPRWAIACPRSPKVMEWNAAAMKWLMEEVRPEAVHIETGDYGICRCPSCEAAGERNGSTSDDDMAVVLPPLVAEIRKHDPDCWISYNHYTGYTRRMMEKPPAFAAALPEDIICKWGVSWMLEPEIQKGTSPHWGKSEPVTPAVHPPTATNMAHLHFGTGWWNCSPRGTLEIARLFDYVPRVREVGFQGLCTHGEDSDLVPASELNYHVFSALADNPKADGREVADRSVGRLFGDDRLAADVLEAYRRRRVPEELPPRVADAAMRARGRVRVRLTWLIFELHHFSDRLLRAGEKRRLSSG